MFFLVSFIFKCVQKSLIQNIVQMFSTEIARLDKCFHRVKNINGTKAKYLMTIYCEDLSNCIIFLIVLFSI